MPIYIDNGLTPDTPAELAEIQRGQVTFESYMSGDWEQEHGPYPQRKYKVPPDISWDSYEPELRKRKAHFDRLRLAGWCLWWWVIAAQYGLDLRKVLSWNQVQKPACAGFSAAAVWSRKTIYQKLTAPVRWEQINPMPMWAITKGYDDKGGQSMAAVKLGAARYGNYAVDDPGIGPYPGRIDRTAYQQSAPQAQSRQLCSCVIPNNIEAVKLCLDACEVVAIGNRTAWRTCRLDAIGLLLAVVSGNWSHAWNYDAIRYIRGIPYFHASNSWGNIYTGSREHDPEIGCWHTMEQAAKLLQTASCWVSVYAEAACDLEPGMTPFAPNFVPYPDYIRHTHS